MWCWWMRRAWPAPPRWGACWTWRPQRRGAAAGRGSDAAVRGRGRRGAAAARPARPTLPCWAGCTGSPTRPKPTASLQLRRGNPAALGFYESRSRLTDGSRQEMLEEVYAAWRQDQAAGCSTLMVSASTCRGRRDCAPGPAPTGSAAGDVEPDGIRLHDGNLAGTGDVVVTRANRRTLAVLGGRDFVKNGDLWRVTARHSTGDLTLTHLGHGGCGAATSRVRRGAPGARVRDDGAPRAGDDRRHDARAGRQEHVPRVAVRGDVPRPHRQPRLRGHRRDARRRPAPPARPPPATRSGC